MLLPPDDAMPDYLAGMLAYYRLQVVPNES